MFLEPCAAPLHRDTRGLEFLLHPALADPDDEPTVAEPVERREPVRENDWALEECIEHAVTRVIRLGLGSNVGKRLDGVVHNAERLGCIHDRPAGSAERDRHRRPHQPLTRHTESKPMRSASAATSRMMLGGAFARHRKVYARPHRSHLPSLSSFFFFTQTSSVGNSPRPGAGPDLCGGADTEAYAAGMSDRTRAARVEDVHRIALAMPQVTVIGGTKDNPVYQVGGKSFVFFRNPRPDAVDPDSGERYRDVIVFWVADEAEKQALIQDESTPFFSTTHFDGHPSVLVQASRLGELSLAELEEIVQDAWLARASQHRAEQWLSSHPVNGRSSAG